MMKLFTYSLISLSLASFVSGDMNLPKPQTEGGKPLMEALKLRRTHRTFADKAIPEQMLSNLLWAAQGVNSDDTDFRTAPTARNMNEIEIYVVIPEGVYLFDPVKHTLKEQIKGDFRAMTGTQPLAGMAPLNLVYVVNQDKLNQHPDPARREQVSHCDTGFIGQNVYLFCASEGLSTVFRGLIDKELLGKSLSLPESKKVLYAQSIGYPGE